MLRRENDVTGRLCLDGVLRCYGLENRGPSPLLVLEDFGGVPLPEVTPPSGMDLDLFFAIAAQLATVLGELHQRRIIHNDINPSTILINRGSGRVKLTGFGLSGPAGHGHAASIPMTSLAYRSPEQTGRVGRGVDYRTDLYSLGVTFYQLLTGRLPFSSDDPLVLIHSHIARQPEPPHTLNAEVPKPVSDIVLKLLAKNPADRYQSGYGLSADLETCRQQQRSGSPESFPLGLRDVPHTVSLAQRLYGRERELAELRAAVDRVTTGAKEVLLVSGLPGIGKTALIEEFRKPLSAGTSLFASGKFDLSKQNVPYSGFIVAFKALIRRVLTQNEEQVRAWKAELQQALGVNGQIMTQVVPELELIIGRQPPPSPAGPIESLNRFNQTMQKFVSVFTDREHPLVLFVDDLQWADPASLDLVKLLLSDPQIGHFLLIGAYRDNTVDAAPPLLLLHDVLSRTQVPVKHLHLPPLSLQLVNSAFSSSTN
jgi:serine/threonine protein kinase